MEKSKNCLKYIETNRVYTKDEQVFTKNEGEDWFPIKFKWISVTASK
ncbi:hypothetical protein [Allomuricauda sp. d1]